MVDMNELIKGVVALFVVGMVAALLLVVAVKFSDGVKDTGTLVEQNQTALVGGVTTTTEDQVESLDGCYDGINLTRLVPGSTCNLTNAQLGTLAVDDRDGAILTLNYTYLEDTDGSTLLDTLVTAIGELGDWFSVLILLSVLIIVMASIFGIYYVVSNTNR